MEIVVFKEMFSVNREINCFENNSLKTTMVEIKIYYFVVIIIIIKNLKSFKN